MLFRSALNNVGQVAAAQGDWVQADKVYRESLAIRRQLVERLGGTPEALRDVSVSLDNVGQVARAQGDWAQADKAYRESLEIRRQLVERLGGTPESLADLANALQRNAVLPGGPRADLLAEARSIFSGLVAAHPTVQSYRGALAWLNLPDNPLPTPADTP